MAIVLISAFAGWMMTGCKTETSTAPVVTSPNGAMVNMAVTFSKPPTESFPGIDGTMFADSLHIDSAVIVFSDIKFLRDADTVSVDSSGDRDGDHDRNSKVVFKGPFVVHVHDTVSIDFASKVLPAGNYDGIKFKIRPLRSGEDQEDCDEHHRHRHHGPWNDSMIVGSSITVWGSVHKDSAWKPFTFGLNDELQFKIKGDFVVPLSTSTVNIALNIDMASWFTNPFDGSLLDPSNVSPETRRLIREAIRISFGKGRGGHDRGDGRPDGD